MPKLAIVFTWPADLGDSEETIYSSFRSKVLEAMQKIGEVDESTLRIDEVSRDAVLNLGSEEEPHYINVAQRNLVAVKFTAEVTPH